MTSPLTGTPTPVDRAAADADARAQAYEAAQRLLFRQLAEGAPITTLLGHTLRMVEARFPDGMPTILLLDDERTRIARGFAQDPDRTFPDAVVGLAIGPAAGSCGTAMWRGEPVATVDIAQDPLWDGYRDLAIPHGLRACWSVPFQDSHGAVLGSFAVYFAAPRAPEDDDLALLADLGDLAAIAVERDGDERRLRLMEACVARFNDAVVIAEIAEGETPVFRYVNAAFSACTGWPGEQVLGRHPRSATAGDGSAPAMLRALLARPVPGRETLRTVTREGRELWLDVDVVPVPDEAGTVIRRVAIARDLTATKRFELQLAQSQRLEAVGRLAGGVAHDFNNMLMAIQGFAELLATDYPPGSGGAPLLDEIRLATERSAALTRKLLAFSRRQVLQPRVVDLNTLVRGLGPLIERLLGDGVDLRLVLREPAPRSRVDPVQLEQVVVNFAVNARDAIDEAGRITILTSHATFGERDSRTIRLGVPPGEYAALAVMDNGAGMSPEVRAHIFEPFFTTRTEQGGTGLGLAMAFGIVTQSGGAIDVDSEPGRGTVMTVFLPLERDASAAPIPAAGPPSGGRGGSEAILLVDDEAPVRKLLERILTTAGYAVRSAATGAEAIALAKETVPIDLLMTDVVLPDTNGRRVAEQLRIDRPALPVLCISGYTADVLRGEGRLPPGMELLEKPFTRNEVLTRVREMLDRK